VLHPRSVLLVLVLVAVPARTAAPDPNAARISAAAAAYEDALARWTAGTTPLDDVYRWSIRWNDAAHDPRAHAVRMRSLAATVQERVAAGVASRSDAKAVDYYVAEAAVLER
jgi:hypothetical protein